MLFPATRPHSNDFISILRLSRQEVFILNARVTTAGPEFFLHDHLENTQEPIYKVGTHQQEKQAPLYCALVYRSGT